MIVTLHSYLIAGNLTNISIKSDVNTYKPIVIRLKSNHPAIVLAGNELVKYLNIMSSNPAAAFVEGDPTSFQFNSEQIQTPFKIELGLLSDFGFTIAGIDNPELDDAVFIDVHDTQGIILGSNPRSVLFAVYRFLEYAGCRWIRPGPNGDYVPLRRIDNLSLNLKDKAVYRFRGNNNSGTYSIDYIISKIEWNTKLGLNTFYNEHIIPKSSYLNWYTKNYPSAKSPEQRTDTEIIAYNELLKQEIKRRGLLLHAAGHGWNARFFGNPEIECDRDGNLIVPEDQTKYLALLKGQRVKQGPTKTELCYGNSEVRHRLAYLVADYAQNNPEVDFIHFWLDDNMNNTCECELCRHTRLSDFYVMILNDIDKQLSLRKINTRIVFLIYQDLYWPPESERFINQDRFVLMFAPSLRSYDESYLMPDKNMVLPSYQLNQNKRPTNIKQLVGFLKEWQQIFQGTGFVYDYIMYWYHFYDQGYSGFTHLFAEDLQRLHLLKLDGFVSCQMQKTFYPHGLPLYAHAKLLWNPEKLADELSREYFEGSFGKDWAPALDYMQTISSLFSPKYFYSKGWLSRFFEVQYSDAQIREARNNLLQVEEATRKFRSIINTNLKNNNPTQQLSWKYLSVHSGMIIHMANVLLARDEGRQADEKAAWKALRDYIVDNEDITEEVFDVFAFQRIFPSLK